MKSIFRISSRNIKKGAALILISALLIAEACDFKSEAEARIMGMAGQGAISVKIISGKGSVKHVLTERDCEQHGYGKPVSYSCSIKASVTKLVQQPSGAMVPQSFENDYEVGVTVPCFPGTKIDLDCEDPLIVQIPEDWSVARATFGKAGQQPADLVVQAYNPPAGLESNYYRPEPGHKLVVIGFPVGTPVDLYDINLEWNFRRTGPRLVKAIFAAEVIYTDPLTGRAHTFLPPVSTRETDFALINDPVFTQEFMAARVQALPVGEQSAAALGLPDPGEMEYMVLDMDGPAPGDVDPNSLWLAVRP